MNGNEHTSEKKDHLLRGIDQGDNVFPADTVSRLGFGSLTQTVQDSSGAFLTSEKRRLFETGPCHCLVAEYQEFGGICEFCKFELEQINLTLPVQEMRSLEQIMWLARPCKIHFGNCVICRVGFCSSRHGITAPDGNAYCIPHYEEIMKNFEEQIIKSESTMLGYAMRKFWKHINF